MHTVFDELIAPLRNFFQNKSSEFDEQAGSQSLFFKDGYAYFNWHGANDYSNNDEFGLDKYSFNGSSFVFIENIQFCIECGWHF